MKRPKKTVLVSVTGLLLLFVAGTLVWGALNKSDSVLNRTEIGTLKGDLHEVFDGEQALLSQVAYPKEVTVQNTGNLNLFVRVMIFPEITSREGLSLAANIGQQLEIEIGPEWLAGADGYYYYVLKLAKDTMTTPVFQELTLADSSLLDEGYQGSSLTIQLKSETITTGDFHYRQAWWGLEQELIPTDPTLAAIDGLLAPLRDKN